MFCLQNPETVADNSAQKIVYPELPRHVALRAEPADALVSSGGKHPSVVNVCV